MKKAAEHCLGAPPELRWIDLDDLTVDTRYQRDTGSDRSRAQIKRMASAFTWAKFAPVIVARSASGKKFSVIDGQHRVLAALERGDIEQVPCCIVDAPELVQQAQSFVGLNRDQLRLTPMAEFYALVAAADPFAQRLQAVLDSAGIRIPKYAPMYGLTKPNECQAVGALMAVLKKYGEGALSFALHTIHRAYPEEPGQMRAMYIKTLAAIYAANAELIDLHHASETAGDIAPEDLQEMGRQAVKSGRATGVLNAMIDGFVKNYNQNLSTDRHIQPGKIRHGV